MVFNGSRCPISAAATLMRLYVYVCVQLPFLLPYHLSAVEWDVVVLAFVVVLTNYLKNADAIVVTARIATK